MEEVVLVDDSDNPLGVMEKLEAHRQGVLHRAFSVLLFNDEGQLLLQRRAKSKYHSAGLWTNTCCSHPRPDENIQLATERRLAEEMGISMSPEFLYSFKYKANLDSNLVEHEFDHVFTGVYNGIPNINPDEVADWRYTDLSDIRTDIDVNPGNYTAWFRLIMASLPERI
nr:isopentenyl-diphosphate Delta-isomerase [Fulvivirga sedimenti]